MPMAVVSGSTVIVQWKGRGSPGVVRHAILGEMVLVLVAAALAAVPGERLEWSARWMGIDAGTAWSVVSPTPEGVRVDAGCRSAPWLAKLYPVEDTLGSEWIPSQGSTRYFTRYREGGYQRDEDVHLRGDPIVARRSQLFDEGWKTWEDRYKAVVGVEDPVSAFYRLRDEAGPVGETLRWKVWSGRWPTSVQVITAAAELWEGKPTLRVEVLAEHRTQDLEPKMTVWLSDDADRVPLAATVHTRAGPVDVRLTGRTVP